MRSSYLENSFGDVFYSIVTAFRPLTCIELGVLDGYSTMHIARGIKENVKFGVNGHLDAYDLFEDYEFKHGDMEEVKKNLGDLNQFVTLVKGDAFEAYKKYVDNSVYLLHIDLSNDGEIIKKAMRDWDSKMVIGGSILLEGGNEERDSIDWMKKYNKTPIIPELENNEIIKRNYVFGVYLKFPGVAHLLKKRS